MQQVSPAQLKEWLAAAQRGEKPAPALIDVREPWEHEICRIEGARLIPMGTITSRLGEIEHDTPTVVICHHGARSAQVGHFLEQQGFGPMVNLAGGVAAWAAQVDPAMPTY